MENSLLPIFDKVPCTIVQGILSNFGVVLKISIMIAISSNFLRTCTSIKNLISQPCIAGFQDFHYY